MTIESAYQRTSQEASGAVEEEYWSSLTNTKDSILIPDLNLLYQRVPKVAGTTISKILLHLLFNDPEGKAIGNANVHYVIGTLLPLLSDYPKKYVYEKFTSKDTFKFTFVRNPYAKLVSCYKDKIQRLQDIRTTVNEATSIAEAMETKQPHFYEEPKYILYNAKMRAAVGKEPYTPYSPKFEVATFEEFARFICDQKNEEMEHHWEPQTVTTNWGKVDYTHIGKQESFIDDMTHVLAALGASSYLYQMLPEKLNMTKRTQTMQSYYPPALQELVYNRFLGDFQAFGYSPELPSGL